jgi:ribosomal protein S10
MDIAKLSMNMAEKKTVEGFQIGMMKKAMDLTEQTGKQLVELMKAVDVPQGSTIDIKI